MSSNKHIKDRMVAKYGPECWIEKLHLRTDTEPRRYTSKAQMKRMKALTYHHIKERRNGGKSTEENGAILSAENHQWFHKQPPEVQVRLNQIFQEYKRQFALLHGDDKKAIEVDGFDKARKYTIQEIIENDYDLDLCGFPHKEEEILPPRELIAHYQKEKARLNVQIDETLDEIKRILDIE